MRRKIAILVGLGLAVAAIAATIDGSEGRGRAVNEAGAVGMFDYRVAKFVDGTNVRIGGGLHFGIRGTEEHPGVAIGMVNCARLAVNGNVCEFSGPGARFVYVDGVRHEIRGIVFGRVEDNRNREHPNAPFDRFAVRFDAEGTEHDFEFHGAVRDGGLAVFHRVQ